MKKQTYLFLVDDFGRPLYPIQTFGHNRSDVALDVHGAVNEILHVLDPPFVQLLQLSEDIREPRSVVLSLQVIRPLQLVGVVVLGRIAHLRFAGHVGPLLLYLQHTPSRRHISNASQLPSEVPHAPLPSTG